LANTILYKSLLQAYTRSTGFIEAIFFIWELI